MFRMADDWRLDNLKMWPELRGLSWVRKPYSAYRPDWDHDHCAACNKTLAELGVEGEYLVHEGYATTSDYEKGADYEWVCSDCFRDIQAEMRWTEVSV